MNSRQLLINSPGNPLNSYNDISLCVQCGRCKASCPTYTESSTETLGARGRAAIIRKFNQGEIIASNRLYKSVFSCILCEACNKICPLHIDIADAVYKIRKNIRNFDKKTILFNYFTRFAFKNHSTTFRIFKTLKIISDIPKIDRLYPFRYFKKMDIAVAGSPFRGKASVFRAQNPRGRIAVFTGCVVNCINPSYGRSLVNILNGLRFDVILPQGEVCCGAPLLELGLEEDAVKLAERNIETFKNLNVEAVISLCPTCTHFIKNIYGRYRGDCIDNALDILQFLTAKASEFPELIKGHNFYNRSTSLINPQAKAIYHDPCHSKYSLNIFSEPRSILKRAGINLIEPSESGCCGFGGTFGLSFEGLSDGILKNRLESYKKADIIITSCPNCILQLKSKIKDRQVMHIIDIIAQIIGKEHA